MSLNQSNNKKQQSNNCQLYLGCAVWSYKGWVGNFYPPKTKPGNFLNLYSQQFNTVEGNTTFYAVPQPKIVEKWVTETHPQFKFCPKFPKDITHKGLLKPKISQALNFLETISALSDRLGIIFAQLPPSYSPQYIDDLKEFLIALNKYNIAVEVRHKDWFKSPHNNLLNNLLSELNIAKVLLDTRPIYNCKDDPQINSNRCKPNVPVNAITTNNFSLIRFISHPDRQYNENFLQEWSIRISNWLQENKTIYFFVHCPIEEKSPFTAFYFKELLQQQGVSIDCLSTNSNPIIPTQLSLF